MYPVYLVYTCLSRDKKEKNQSRCAERKRKKTLPDDSLVRIHTIYTLRKISNNGPQSFFFLRLILFIVHPSTDGLPYGLENELASSQLHLASTNGSVWTVAYIPCTMGVGTIPNPVPRIDPILSNSSLLSVRVLIIIWRDRRADFCSIKIFLKMSDQLVNQIDMYIFSVTAIRFDRVDITQKRSATDLDLSWFENTVIRRHVRGSRPPKAIPFIVKRLPN